LQAGIGWVPASPKDVSALIHTAMIMAAAHLLKAAVNVTNASAWY